MSRITNKVSDAELEVLKVLWASESAMSERQVLDVMEAESEWSPTTIKTLMKRLFEKGAIRREKREVFYYSPVVSETELAKERTVDLLNKVFGGDAKSLVSAMLDSDILSEDDIDELKSYWKDRREKE